MFGATQTAPAASPGPPQDVRAAADEEKEQKQKQALPDKAVFPAFEGLASKVTSETKLQILEALLVDERKRSAAKDEQIAALQKLLDQLEGALSQQRRITDLERMLAERERRDKMVSCGMQTDAVAEADGATDLELMARLQLRLETLEQALAGARTLVAPPRAVLPERLCSVPRLPQVISREPPSPPGAGQEASAAEQQGQSLMAALAQEHSRVEEAELQAGLARAELLEVQSRVLPSSARTSMQVPPPLVAWRPTVGGPAARALIAGTPCNLRHTIGAWPLSPPASPLPLLTAPSVQSSPRLRHACAGSPRVLSPIPPLAIWQAPAGVLTGSIRPASARLPAGSARPQSPVPGAVALAGTPCTMVRSASATGRAQARRARTRAHRTAKPSDRTSPTTGWLGVGPETPVPILRTFEVTHLPLEEQALAEEDVDADPCGLGLPRKPPHCRGRRRGQRARGHPGAAPALAALPLGPGGVLGPRPRRRRLRRSLASARPLLGLVARPRVGGAAGACEPPGLGLVAELGGSSDGRRRRAELAHLRQCCSSPGMSHEVTLRRRRRLPIVLPAVD